jgi:hypothetical protein
MGYLTEAKLSNVADIPVGLPATEIKMGDWVIVASVKVVSPMKLTYRLLNLQVHTSTVDISLIQNVNKVFGNLGIAYVVVRRDYTSGTPGAAGALDVLTATGLGVFSRDAANVVELTTPGTYSWIIANNTQPSSDSSSLIPSSTSIDFRMSVTGQVRLELDSQ